MFSKVHFPQEPLSPEELDIYLSKGWFRIGQTIFTCTYIALNQEIYRVFWLRIPLSKLHESSSFKKLVKLNSRFKVKIGQASITAEKEALYQKYKGGISFEPSESLQHLLYGEQELNVYNTLEVAIYDGQKLIAVGFFDIGKKSAAGISCFYDPDYKKFSLGRYLIYQKMQYCKMQEMDYFYTGYFAPGCKAFDYKLDLVKNGLEYFEISDQDWHSFENWNEVTGSIQENKEKLILLQDELTKVRIENRLFRYGYWQINLFREFEGMDMFDYLMFVYCFEYDPDILSPVIVYDIHDLQYHLLVCTSFGSPNNDAELHEEYSAQLLKVSKVLYSTDSAEEMAKLLGKAIVRIHPNDVFPEKR